MVQLKILSGKKAGDVFVARRFPVRIGRSSKADVALEDPGVWDEHLELQFQRGDGFVLVARPEAPALVNGQAAQRTLLQNGDSIEIGSVKMRFWLSEARQRGFYLREWFVWALVIGVTAGQLGLLYWLLP